MTKIVMLSELIATMSLDAILAQLDSIFFKSSARSDFSNESERSQFRYKYLDWYLLNHPEFFQLATDSNKNILGYICGTADTNSSSELFTLHPWLQCLQSYLNRFPAHLHINLAENARGSGLGSLLLKDYEHLLKSRNIAGLHLVTAPDARNVGFYRKNGYNFETTFQWKNVDLLFMGKHL